MAIWVIDKQFVYKGNKGTELHKRSPHKQCLQGEQLKSHTKISSNTCVLAHDPIYFV
jgi:hypothetical protein